MESIFVLPQSIPDSGEADLGSAAWTDPQRQLNTLLLPAPHQKDFNRRAQANVQLILTRDVSEDDTITAFDQVANLDEVDCLQ